MNLPFADKRPGLKVWGIVFIVLGALAGCFTLFIPFGVVLLYSVPANQVRDRSAAVVGMIGATAMYASFAGGLIWLGIASLRFAKWVRPIVLTLSAVAVAMSLIGIISMLVSLPALNQSMSTMTVTTFNPATSTQPAGPPTVTTRPMAIPAQTTAGLWFGAAIGVVVMLGLGVVLPSAVFWFYRQAPTLQTLEFFDQRPRWTDGCPVPVLGVAIASVLLIGSILIGLLQQFALLPGSRLVIVVLLNMVQIVLLGATAILSYRRQFIGWTLALIAVIVGGATAIVMIHLTDLAAHLASLGLEPSGSSSFSSLTTTQKITQYTSVGLMTATALGYLAWCRQFYDNRPAPTSVQQ